jgi:chitin synthase
MCFPGCFSLFRAKGLMDDNVMKMYTTKSENPRDYVQYDQVPDLFSHVYCEHRAHRI